MTTAITSLFIFGWMKLFNLPGLTMMMILVPLVKRRIHLWVYIIGSYAAYASATIAIYFGIDRLLVTFYGSAKENYPLQLAAGLSAAALAALLIAILITRYIVTSFCTKTEMSFTSALNIQSAHPAVLLFFAFTSVWSGIPAHAGMWAYLAVLASVGISLSSAVTLLLFYCSLTVVPLIVIYVLLHKMSGERFQSFMAKLTKICTYVSMITLPVIFGFAAVWCIVTAVKLF